MVALPGLRGRKVVAQRSAGELDAMAAAGALVAAALRGGARGRRTRRVHSRPRRGRRIGHPRRRRHPVVPRLPRLPGHHLLLGQRPRRARHPVGHRGRSPPATWCPSTAAPSSTAGTATRRVTFGVGPLIPADEALSEATRLSMEAGIAAMVPGNRLTDVSHAIETRHPRRRGALRPQVRHRRGLRRARHRPADAHGPVPAQRGLSPAAGRTWRRVPCWPSSRC